MAIDYVFTWLDQSFAEQVDRFLVFREVVGDVADGRWQRVSTGTRTLKQVKQAEQLHIDEPR